MPIPVVSQTTLDRFVRCSSAVIVSLAIAMPWSAGTANAQRSQAWKSCVDQAGGPTELVINGCNLVIQSGAATAEQLVQAYGRRCDVLIFRDYAPSHLGYCDEAIAREPKGAWHWYSRARAYVELWDYGQAITNYDEAVRLEPKFAFAYRDLCELSLRARRQPDSALSDCNEALRLLPDSYSTSSVIVRGYVYLEQGKLDLAIADFNRTLAREADSAPALYGRGLAKVRMGDESSGKADITAAATINPKTVRDMESFGEIFR